MTIHSIMTIQGTILTIILGLCGLGVVSAVRTLDISQRYFRDATSYETRNGTIWTTHYHPLPDVSIHMVVDGEDFIWIASSGERMGSLKIICDRLDPKLAVIESIMEGEEGRKYYFRHRRDDAQNGSSRVRKNGDHSAHYDAHSGHSGMTIPWRSIPEQEYRLALGHLLFRGLDISAPVESSEVLMQWYQPFGAPTQTFIPRLLVVKYVVYGPSKLWEAKEEKEHCTLVVLHGSDDQNGSGGKMDDQNDHHNDPSDHSIEGHAGHPGMNGGEMSQYGMSSRTPVMNIRETKWSGYHRAAKEKGMQKTRGMLRHGGMVNRMATQDASIASTGCDECDVMNARRGVNVMTTHGSSLNEPSPPGSSITFGHSMEPSRLMPRERIVRIEFLNSQGVNSLYLERVENKWVKIERRRFYERMEEMDEAWHEWVNVNDGMDGMGYRDSTNECGVGTDEAAITNVGGDEASGEGMDDKMETAMAIMEAHYGRPEDGHDDSEGTNTDSGGMDGSGGAHEGCLGVSMECMEEGKMASSPSGGRECE